MNGPQHTAARREWSPVAPRPRGRYNGPDTGKEGPLMDMRMIGIGLLAVVLLTACGQKGDLYLPDSAAARAVTPIAA